MLCQWRSNGTLLGLQVLLFWIIAMSYNVHRSWKLKQGSSNGASIQDKSMKFTSTYEEGETESCTCSDKSRLHSGGSCGSCCCGQKQAPGKNNFLGNQRLSQNQFLLDQDPNMSNTGGQVTDPSSKNVEVTASEVSVIKDVSTSQAVDPKVRRSVKQERQEENYRVKLPSAQKEKYPSLWSILKHFVSVKDITKISLPVFLNEPLSMLQRLANGFEYAELLKAASVTVDPVHRMELVVAFIVSSLSYNHKRTLKPFNSLMGETFEFSWNGCRFHSEQVRHHPPIAAFHCEGDGFECWGSQKVAVNVRAGYINFLAEGPLTVTLLLRGAERAGTFRTETYTWNQVEGNINNVMLGTPWLELAGKMTVLNHHTGWTTVLTFKPAGWMTKPHHCEGLMRTHQGKPVRYFYGTWPSYLDSCHPKSAASVVIHDVAGVEIKHSKSTRSAPDLRDESSIMSPPDLRDESSMMSTPALRDESSMMSPPDLKDESSMMSPPDLSEESSTSGKKANSEGGFDTGGPANPPSPREQGTSYSNSNLTAKTKLWKVRPRASYSEDYYDFTAFTFRLNQMPQHPEGLCPTDSRFRSDIQALEQGDLELAGKYKNALEVKQRVARNKGKEPKAKWFEETTHPLRKEAVWKSNGLFWKREFQTCPSLYLESNKWDPKVNPWPQTSTLVDILSSNVVDKKSTKNPALISADQFKVNE